MAGSAPRHQHSHHNHDAFKSIRLDCIWILCPDDSRFTFDLNIRQPFSQVFDHRVVQADLPQNILPPHDPSDRDRIAVDPSPELVFADSSPEMIHRIHNAIQDLIANKQVGRNLKSG
jgi:hypothetical protein